MTDIFIIHGAYGNPEENWFSWLKFELEKLGHRVFIPKFPTPEKQSLENWLKVFDEYKENLNEDSIVVGHSLGPAFLLNVIENLDKPIKAAFFVSGFLDLLGNSDFDSINKSFIERKFDWKKIKRKSSNFFVFHSDNDPYIPLEQAKKLAKNLGISPIIVKNAGHFNEKAGYFKFNLILEKIESLL